MQDRGQCSECKERDCLSGYPIAMAYVPWQSWKITEDLCKGFHQGTIFPVLVKPFLGYK